MSHETSETSGVWPGPQGLERFQDPLPFLYKVLPDLLCLQAGTESRQCPGRSEEGQRPVLKLEQDFSFNFPNNETIYLRLALEPTWLGLNPVYTHGSWFQNRMQLRFLMSQCRKNSVKDKVTGKKRIYSDSERSTLHRQSVGCRRG